MTLVACCHFCLGCGWICEEHLRPYPHEDHCTRIPCPLCIGDDAAHLSSPPLIRPQDSTDFEFEATAILTSAHLNVLLLGADESLERSLAIVMPFLRRPVLSWTPADNVPLPEGPCGTLTVHAIDTATAQQQSDLLSWLERRAGMTQIVSMSAALLAPKVTRDEFLETLYYRLNHLTFYV